MKRKKKKIRLLLGIFLAGCMTAQAGTTFVWSNNLKKYTETAVSFREPPRYTGTGVNPEDFMTVQVFTDLEKEEPTEITGLPISYSYYVYRLDRPEGPDETIDKLDWDETPSQTGTYWVKAKFLGDNQYHPSSSDYYQFQIVPGEPRLELYTDMTQDTRIGDTIVVTAEFTGVQTEPEDFQPLGKAVFQAGGRFIDAAVDFDGRKAQVNYTLTTEPVDIKAEYVPGGEGENYARTEALLSGVMGVKREQQPLVIAGESVAYGVEPYIITVTGGSGEGVLSYASGDEKIASVSEKGKITIHHPGTVEIQAVKAEDDTYAQASASYQLEVQKGINPNKPKLPVLMETAENRIRVKQTEGQEFSIDGGKNWTDTGVFDRLTAKKKYTVITRLCETEYYLPGQSTKFLQVTTEKKSETPAQNPGQQLPGGNESGTSGNGGENKNAGGSLSAPTQAPSGQSRQWGSLGGTSGTVSEGSTLGTAAKTGEREQTESTDRKKAWAKGKVKGSQSEQAESKESQKSEQPDREEDQDEAVNEEIPKEPEQEENKIMSTGAARPKKKGIPLKAAAGIAVTLIAAAGAGGWIWIGGKRRRAV